MHVFNIWSIGRFNCCTCIFSISDIFMSSLARLTSTVSELTKSIKTLTEDADDISEKIEDLLVKTNSLMDDVNQKSSKLDPLFQATSDLGESVSDLNQASRNFVENMGNSTHGLVKTSTMLKNGLRAIKLINKLRKK